MMATVTGSGVGAMTLSGELVINEDAFLKIGQINRMFKGPQIQNVPPINHFIGILPYIENLKNQINTYIRDRKQMENINYFELNSRRNELLQLLYNIETVTKELDGKKIVNKELLDRLYESILTFHNNFVNLKISTAFSYKDEIIGPLTVALNYLRNVKSTITTFNNNNHNNNNNEITMTLNHYYEVNGESQTYTTELKKEGIFQELGLLIFSLNRGQNIDNFSRFMSASGKDYNPNDVNSTPNYEYIKNRFETIILSIKSINDFYEPNKGNIDKVENSFKRLAEAYQEQLNKMNGDNYINNINEFKSKIKNLANTALEDLSKLTNLF